MNIETSTIGQATTAATGTDTAPRRRHGAAAVIARYIQDLAHDAAPAPCLAGA